MKHPVMTQRRKLSSGFDYKPEVEVDEVVEMVDKVEDEGVVESVSVKEEPEVQPKVAVETPLEMKPKPAYIRPTPSLLPSEVSKHPRNTLRYTR